MSNLIRCPDCGGIVGATEVTDEGPPCSCFAQSAASADDSASGEQEAQSAQKVCRVCGKDLTGKKRLKDSLGYWCPECAREDAKSKEDKGTPCGRCGRKVPEASMTSVDGKMVCTRCMREERELRAPGSKKFRVISDRSYKEHDKKQMIIMALVLVVLLVLMAIAWQHRPWAHVTGPDAPASVPTLQSA